MARRRRSKEALAAYAILENLMEGYPPLTIPEIVERTGVARTSIYRFPVVMWLMEKQEEIGKQGLLQGSKFLDRDDPRQSRLEALFPDRENEDS